MTIQDKLKETWAKACEWDGIPVVGSRFVVFSDDNPYIKEHDKWIRMYQAGELSLRHAR